MASIILVLFRFSSNLHQHTSTPSERNEIIYQIEMSLTDIARCLRFWTWISLTTNFNNKKKLEIGSLIGCIICISASMIFSSLKLPDAKSSANGLADSLRFLPVLSVFIMFICAFSFLICLAILLAQPALVFVNSSHAQPNIDTNITRFVDSKIAQFVEGEIIRFESIIFGIAAALRIISFFAVVDFLFFAILYTITL